MKYLSIMEPNGSPAVSADCTLECGIFEMNSTRMTKVDDLPSAAPDPKAVEAIGRALEAHYSSLIQAPLPDKFVELLARLERDQVSQTQERPDALG